jgi:hypothetical protein
MRFALAAFAVLMLAALGGVATAGAAPKAEPTVELVGKVKINKDGTGTVKARYICTPGDDWHLWVSAKQSADGSRDESILNGGGGFSGAAPTWLQSHPTTFRCDGKWHTQKFIIDKEEVGRGTLVKGEAYVQICLIKGGSETEDPEFFLVDEGWRKVR